MNHEPFDIEKIINHFVENQHGRKLLLDIWCVIQAWDDARDGDENEFTDLAFRLSNVDIPANPLYVPFNTLFQIQQMYLKWEAANAIEEAKLREHLPKSYVLRAEYYQLIVNMICFLEGVQVAAAKAPDVWVCYGEPYEEYEKEICQTQTSQSSGGA